MASGYELEEYAAPINVSGGRNAVTEVAEDRVEVS